MQVNCGDGNAQRILMSPINPYQQLYVNLHFERAGLFRLIKKALPITTVFYPCCSFHITPSFFFPKVYYLDKSEVVAKFFHDEALVSKIIQSKKEVSQPYWKFLHSDVESSLETIPEVDLVIALFGGDVLKHAFTKVRASGYILTSSEFSGNDFLKNNNQYNCLFNIVFQSGEYKVLKSVAGDRKVTKKSFTRGNVFRDTLLYSVYEKM